MSFSPVVTLLLAAAWVLPAVIVSLLYRFPVARSSGRDSVRMQRSVKALQVDIGNLDLDTRLEGREQNWEGADSYVKAQVTEFSNEVTLLAPYADASVSLRDGSGASSTRRHCSLCLN